MLQIQTFTLFGNFMDAGPYDSPESSRRSQPFAVHQIFSNPVYRFVALSSFLFVVSLVPYQSSDHGIAGPVRINRSTEIRRGLPPWIILKAEFTTDGQGSDRKADSSSISFVWDNLCANLTWVAVVTGVVTWFFHPLLKPKSPDD